MHRTENKSERVRGRTRIHPDEWEREGKLSRTREEDDGERCGNFETETTKRRKGETFELLSERIDFKGRSDIDGHRRVEIVIV